MPVSFQGHFTELPTDSIDDLWLFPKRNELGIEYDPLPGGFIPEVPHRLITRFSREGWKVYDPMAGAMVTHRVARLLDREPVSVDLQMRGDIDKDPLYKELIIADARQYDPGPVDLIIWHPPYKDVIRFSEDVYDISTMDDHDFWWSITECLINFDTRLSTNRYCCIVIGNVYKNQRIEPLAFRLLSIVEGHPALSRWQLKGLVVKDIRGNNQSGAGLQRYRAVHLMDSFTFRYEFILVFKKV